MLKTIKSLYVNSSLRKKIIIIAFGTAFASMLCCVIFGSVYYNTEHKKNLNRQISENLTVLSNQIASQFNDTVLCSNYLTLSLNQIESQQDLRFYRKYDQLTSLFSGTLLIFNGLDSIVYVDSDGNFYSTAPELIKKSDDIVSSEYFKACAAAKNGTTHLFNMTGDCMFKNSEKPVITMGKKITEFSSGETLGYLFINISVAYIESICSVGTNHYYVYDALGQCISNTADDFYENTAGRYLSKETSGQKIQYSGEYYMIQMTGIEDRGWSILSVTNLNAYFLNVYQFIGLLVFTSVVIFIMLVFISIYVTNIITKPLGLLTKGADDIASGNLSVRFDFKTDDDIGRMGRAFTRMAEEISLLIKKVDAEAAGKRTYELALIQEQVKPHFLYNTLDIIIVLTEMGKYKEANRVTRKLADYYRNSLSSSAEFIPLSKEFRIVEDYLDLQLMRYQDKFTYCLNLPDEYGSVLIPKLTLQPLVENALYHGLKEKIEWGNIDINAHSEGDFLILEVTDNGLGMTQKMLSELNNPDGKPDKHFGIYSVRHRLELYYPGKCSLSVESEFREGTKVTVKIPLSKETTENRYD